MKCGGSIMYCTSCGTFISADDVFCHECGKKVSITNSQIMDNAIYNTRDETIQATNKETSLANWWSIPEITKVLIVSSDSRKSASSSIIRGAIGGSVLGPIGLLGGLVSGKNRNSTTFLVFFSNGKKKTITCKTNSRDFNYYVKYVE